MKTKRKNVLTGVAIAAYIIFLIIAYICISVMNMNYMQTFWALTPPIIAIALALITKEAYSSLAIGIVTGAFLWAGFHPVDALNHVFSDGIVSVLSDSYNVGILIFLVILGMMVQLMNRSGGSAAFGVWTSKHIKTRVGAQIATILLGCLIFIDDYFNCLTVGSVMRPVTDKQKVSRAKLAYLIDATAAPICIIAPISSWAAAVSGFAGEGQNGIHLFVQTIPYNFYAILTIVMMFTLVLSRSDYGPMERHENRALQGDLFTEGERPEQKEYTPEGSKTGTVIDMLFPIIALIIFCVIGMIYTGGFFEGETFVDAFANSDASIGLVLGSAVAMVLTIIFYLIRKTLSFTKCMECLPEGFKQMVPAILILTFAWSLKAMTDSLGAKEYVAGLVQASAGGFLSLLPAIVFLISIALAFATGTSWGTFGILIPIVIACFPNDPTMTILSMSACMAGAVCGDHCSPISDTTIMSSAGAQCAHINHVSTQMPYALTCAAVSFVTYIIAGFAKSWLIALPIGVILMVGTVLLIAKKHKANA